eukprot:CAMPEP_0202449964 /NCGR_PEP_ID=MMETSP1360-20130828/8623_1 /ASSEMBLY_ACC=CAM_ASM_000848 /TAXON_ID=515479 /ORGANISM="Licmophora paradoxa, Strain CCMP2313" /LENGTH=638 /DNA_ID=CAMNT_0049068059 /DNA_START=68 /DNA_END=1984 /DNA_ORIENTATION=+
MRTDTSPDVPHAPDAAAANEGENDYEQPSVVNEAQRSDETPWNPFKVNFWRNASHHRMPPPERKNSLATTHTTDCLTASYHPTRHIPHSSNMSDRMPDFAGISGDETIPNDGIRDYGTYSQRWSRIWIDITGHCKTDRKIICLVAMIAALLTALTIFLVLQIERQDRNTDLRGSVSSPQPQNTIEVTSWDDVQQVCFTTGDNRTPVNISSLILDEVLEIEEILGAHHKLVADATIVEDICSPQILAKFRLSQFEKSHPTKDLDRLHAKYILSVFYFATGGRNWLQSSGWTLPGAPECDWFGIDCDWKASVVSISLPQNGLRGYLPDELYELTSLQHLLLTNNIGISGPLSPKIGGLEDSLESLQLGESSITGTLPTELDLLTRLKTLDIHSNTISGELPENLLLPDLEVLRLRFPFMGGTIPNDIKFRLSTKLTDLRLEGHWNDELSEAFWLSLSSSSSLRYFSLLCRSAVRTRIPDSFFASNPNMIEFLVRTNHLSGSIPTTVGFLTSLISFSLSGNPEIHGTIPTELGRLSASLTLLAIENNRLEGSVPSELGDLTELRVLALRGNRLGGTIPESLSGLKNLEHFVLGPQIMPRGFSGTIPESICYALDRGGEENQTMIVVGQTDVFNYCSCCTIL